MKRSVRDANRLQAWADWDREKNRAWSLQLGPLASRYAPPPGSGWRKIDKHIGMLRTAISAALAEREVVKVQS